METLSKSDIIRQLTWAIDHCENIEGECLERKKKKVIKFSIKISDEETFTDANGVKWVRA